jgi:hypothetical protein
VVRVDVAATARNQAVNEPCQCRAVGREPDECPGEHQSRPSSARASSAISAPWSAAPATSNRSSEGRWRVGAGCPSLADRAAPARSSGRNLRQVTDPLFRWAGLWMNDDPAVDHDRPRPADAAQWLIERSIGRIAPGLARQRQSLRANDTPGRCAAERARAESDGSR